MTTPDTNAPSAGPSRRGWHRVGAFQRCPQYFAYRHRLHLVQRREPPGRALGALVHIGLMWHYLARLGQPGPDPIDAMRAAPERIVYRIDAAIDLFRAYVARWPIADDWRPIAVEHEYEARIGGWLHTQRIDLVAEVGGRAVVVDHKTTAGAVGAAGREWELSGQFIALDVIGRAIVAPAVGLPYGGVVVNVLGTRSPVGPSSFARHPVRIDPALVTPALTAIAETNADIQAAADRDPWTYRRHHGACVDRFGVCEYAALCRRGRAAESEFDVAVDIASEIET